MRAIEPSTVFSRGKLFHVQGCWTSPSPPSLPSIIRARLCQMPKLLMNERPIETIDIRKRWRKGKKGRTRGRGVADGANDVIITIINTAKATLSSLGHHSADTAGAADMKHTRTSHTLSTCETSHKERKKESCNDYQHPSNIQHLRCCCITQSRLHPLL